MMRFLVYVAAIAGPATAAVAQFALSLVCIKLLSVAEFGVFTLNLTIVQLAQSIWTALYCAPIQVVNGTASQVKSMRDAIYAMSFTSSLALGALHALGILVFEPQSGSVFLIAVCTVTYLNRWFLRALTYCFGRNYLVFASDLVYSMLLIVLTGLWFWWPIASLWVPFASMIVASLAGGLVCLAGCRGLVYGGLIAGTKALATYADIWKRYSSWSVLGVVTTEMTANAHVYLVSALVGPAALAPIAASALIVRPTQVSANALSEYGRARISRCYVDGNFKLVRDEISNFRIVLAGVLIINVLLALAILYFGAPYLPHKDYDFETLAGAAALWFGVALIRNLRTPESVFIQAVGDFKPLAFASVWSGAVSVAAVVGTVLLLGPVLSIVAVGVGELIYAAIIWSIYGETRNRLKGHGSR